MRVSKSQHERRTLLKKPQFCSDSYADCPCLPCLRYQRWWSWPLPRAGSSQDDAHNDEPAPSESCAVLSTSVFSCSWCGLRATAVAAWDTNECKLSNTSSLWLRAPATRSGAPAGWRARPGSRTLQAPLCSRHLLPGAAAPAGHGPLPQTPPADLPPVRWYRPGQDNFPGAGREEVQGGGHGSQIVHRVCQPSPHGHQQQCDNWGYVVLRQASPRVVVSSSLEPRKRTRNINQANLGTESHALFFYLTCIYY